jgi:hypothetical protein
MLVLACGIAVADEGGVRLRSEDLDPPQVALTDAGAQVAAPAKPEAEVRAPAPTEVADGGATTAEGLAPAGDAGHAVDSDAGAAPESSVDAGSIPVVEAPPEPDAGPPEVDAGAAPVEVDAGPPPEVTAPPRIVSAPPEPSYFEQHFFPARRELSPRLLLTGEYQYGGAQSDGTWLSALELGLRGNPLFPYLDLAFRVGAGRYGLPAQRYPSPTAQPGLPGSVGGPFVANQSSMFMEAGLAVPFFSLARSPEDRWQWVNLSLGAVWHGTIAQLGHSDWSNPEQGLPSDSTAALPYNAVRVELANQLYLGCGWVARAAVGVPVYEVGATDWQECDVAGNCSNSNLKAAAVTSGFHPDFSIGLGYELRSCGR